MDLRPYTLPGFLESPFFPSSFCLEAQYSTPSSSGRKGGNPAESPANPGAGLNGLLKGSSGPLAGRWQREQWPKEEDYAKP
jgi:hypothetical protein